MRPANLAAAGAALLLLLSACAPPRAKLSDPTPSAPTQMSSPTVESPAEQTLGPTNLPAPDGTDRAGTPASPSPTAAGGTTDLPQADPVPTGLCSPLADISLAELPGILTNPFQAPRPGLDDAHHGADFAYYRRGERASMRGLPVFALLGGRVAGLTLDRRPYGYMIIIETPLEELPQSLLTLLPGPAPTPQPQDIRLTCPPESFTPRGDPSRRSLYTLYAHLNTAPLPAAGAQVACGEQIGEVGTTGASINEHLHLETRLGPAGAAFGSMAHYDPSASPSEQAEYCAWRVSGQFGLLDPLTLILPPAP